MSLNPKTCVTRRGGIAGRGDPVGHPPQAELDGASFVPSPGTKAHGAFRADEWSGTKPEKYATGVFVYGAEMFLGL